MELAFTGNGCEFKIQFERGNYIIVAPLATIGYRHVSLFCRSENGRPRMGCETKLKISRDFNSIGKVALLQKSEMV